MTALIVDDEHSAGRLHLANVREVIVRGERVADVLIDHEVGWNVAECLDCVTVVERRVAVQINGGRTGE